MSFKSWEDNAAGLKLCLPLWQNDRRELVAEFIALGFKAMIVTVNERMLSPDYLGRELSRELLKELEEEGVDPCGENGEFHTVVLDGPIFRRPLLPKLGEVQRGLKVIVF